MSTSDPAIPTSRHASPGIPALAPSLSEDLTTALQGVEHGLAQIRRMYREADEAKMALASHQVELERRSVELNGIASQIESSREELRSQRESLERRERETGEKSTRVDADQRALDELNESMQKRSVEFDERANRVAEEQQSLGDRARELGARETSLASALEELHRREEALAESGRTLHTQTAELGKRAEAVRREEERVRREQGDTQSLRQSLAAAQQQASQTIRALQDATSRAEQAEEAARVLRNEMEELRSQQQTFLDEAELRCQAAEETLATTRDELRVKQEAETRLASSIADLRSQLQRATENRAGLDRQLSEARESLAAARASAAVEPAATVNVAAIETRLAAAINAESSAARSLNERTRELADARLVIDDLRLQLEQNAADTTELEGILDQLRDRLRTQAAKAEAYAAQVQHLEAQLLSKNDTRDAQVTLAAPSIADPVREPAMAILHNPALVDEFNRLRRGRLGGIRKHLQSKEAKVAKASEVLAKRYEQCEQVLSLRQDVLTAKRAVDVAHHRIASVQARSRAASSIFFGVCVLAIIGGLSWIVAGQVAPEQFLAKVTIAAENRDRALSGGELGEWQSFHEALIKDPRFLQFAAGRMERQGIATLSTPVTLKERLDHDLAVQAGKPGELTLELKGHGVSRTERELQTLAIAVQSQARDSQGTRVDGANTIIRDPAKASADPIQSVRQEYAVVIFGALALVAGILAFIIWHRLSQAKLRFEAGSGMDATEDDARWPMQERKVA